MTGYINFFAIIIILKEIKSATIGDDVPKMLNFSDLSEAVKQQDRKDLQELQVKTRKFISKARDTDKSCRTAADKLDAVCKDCRNARVTGSIGSILGGCLAIGVTVMTGGAAAPLAFGAAIGAVGATTTVGSSTYEAYKNSSEIKKAEKDLQETSDRRNEVKKTIELWLVKKEKKRLMYICCHAQMTLKASDPAVIEILQELVVPHLERSATPMELKMLERIGWTVLQAASIAAVTGGVQAGVKVALGGAMQGAAQVGAQASSRLLLGVGTLFVSWELINLSFTIRDIVQNQGSEAAQRLRQKADELESAISFSADKNKKLL